MKTEFAFLKTDENDHTLTINAYRKRNIMVVPLLDENNHLVKIYNLREIHSILPIDAVLMAGGKGERLRPLTEKIPKPLLPVGNKAIIDRNIERLISFGLEHIYVTVNYLKEQLEDHFAEPIQGVKVNTLAEGSRPRNKARRISPSVNVPMTCSLRFCTKTTIACPDSLSSLASADKIVSSCFTH